MEGNANVNVIVSASASHPLRSSAASAGARSSRHRDDYDCADGRKGSGRHCQSDRDLRGSQKYNALALEQIKQYVVILLGGVDCQPALRATGGRGIPVVKALALAHTCSIFQFEQESLAVSSTSAPRRWRMRCTCGEGMGAHSNLRPLSVRARSLGHVILIHIER
jgi:hypothetical protein